MIRLHGGTSLVARRTVAWIPEAGDLDNLQDMSQKPPSCSYDVTFEMSMEHGGIRAICPGYFHTHFLKGQVFNASLKATFMVCGYIARMLTHQVDFQASDVNPRKYLAYRTGSTIPCVLHGEATASCSLVVQQTTPPTLIINSRR